MMEQLAMGQKSWMYRLQILTLKVYTFAINDHWFLWNVIILQYIIMSDKMNIQQKSRILYLAPPSCWLFFHRPGLWSSQCRNVLCPESLPQPNTAVIVGSVCGGLFLLVLIAAAVCITMKMLHNRHDYEGWVSPPSQLCRGRDKTVLSGRNQAKQKSLEKNRNI